VTGADPKDCLDDDTIAAVASGAITDIARASVDAHLDVCTECRRLVSLLASAPAHAEPHGDARSGTGAGRLHRGATVGRFVVLERVGAGGMGVVYSAYDPELERNVALKLIAFFDEDGAKAREVLAKEAKAMARVSHPNVVAIHDVGRIGDDLFITMELVDGENLREHLRSNRLDVAGILALFEQAGRGLAAAHAAGLVHRDFKPDNALVGRDGRVRVTDFGLALASHGAGDAAPEEDRNVGADVAGTPAYMAPERGQPDARSDQYSFCVALLEALTGASPGARMSAADARRVPRFVRAAIERGLRQSPEERFPTMAELLRALDLRRRARFGRLYVALVTACVLGCAFASVHMVRQGRVCVEPTDPFAGAWDDAHKDAAKAAFLSVGRPFAADAWERVERALDARVVAWRAMRTASCRASLIDAKQPLETMALRAACLDRRRKELTAAIAVLIRADQTVVEHAVDAVDGLPPIAECDGRMIMDLGPPPPSDAAQASQVEAVREGLDRAKAEHAAGHYAEGLRLVQSLLEPASRTHYSPLVAEVTLLQGVLLEETWDLGGAEEALYRAAREAESVHDDRTAARAWTRLVRLVGYRAGRHEQGDVLARVAESSVARAGSVDDLPASYEVQVATLASAEGRYAAAREHAERAVALAEQMRGPNDALLAAAMDALEAALERAGRDSDALALAERARTIRVARLGSGHPEVARSFVNLAWVALRAGRLDEAEAACRSALAIYEASRGPADPQIAVALDPLGLALVARARVDDGIAALERALSLEKAPHAEHPYVAAIELHLAQAFSAAERHDDAVRMAQEGLAMRKKLLRENHPSVGEAERALASVLRAAGRAKEAVAHAELALAIAEHGEAHELRGEALVELGRARLESGEARLAIPVLERALEADEASLRPATSIVATFALAKALSSSREDPARARTLALDAATRAQNNPLVPRADVRAIEAWAASRPR
jgi:tetratricopeptide (TPR) repeat protein